MPNKSFAAVAVAVLFSRVLAGAADQTVPVRDAQAVQVLLQSVSRLTGGSALADATIKASVAYSLGTDEESGTAVLEVKGFSLSRFSLSLPESLREEVRNATHGVWSGKDGQKHVMGLYNCVTTPVWFFPHAFLVNVLSDAAYGIAYVGSEQRGNAKVHHIHVSYSGFPDVLARELSGTELYLDVSSLLPVALVYQQHPDSNVLQDLPTETDFSNYQQSDGFQYAGHVVRQFLGNPIYTFDVSSVGLNTGLADSDFDLQ